jgi:hypothetical protein
MKSDAINLVAWTPLPDGTAPRTGSFYLASLFQDGRSAPPLPVDPFAGARPIFALNRDAGIYLIGDTASFSLLTAQFPGATLSSFNTERASSSTLAAAETSGNVPAFAFSGSDLWLEIVGWTNGTARFVVHPPASEIPGVYDLFMTTNLGSAGAGLNLTNWEWLLRCGLGQTNWIVTHLTANQGYFLAAKTNDADADALSDAFERLSSHTNPLNGDQNTNGIPDGWEWSYFGSLQPADADFDGDGLSNYAEYSNGTDPNKIVFSINSSNSYTRTISTTLSLIVSKGVPSSAAILVDDTDFDSANWSGYSPSNVTVNLISEGWHDVWIGLRGRLTNSTPAWQYLKLKLDTTPPLLVVTNPTSPTVAQPMIELQGFSVEPLARFSCDLSNSLGFTTNTMALAFDRDYDTNVGEFSTNYFQVFDVPITNGLNVLTLHAIDLAGNVSTTNVYVTLDYGGKTNAPVIQLHWPRDGQTVSGGFAIRGLADDFTASVSASFVDTNGVTNILDAIVERDGTFWIENVPPTIGSTTLQVTATDATGNKSATNFTVFQSPISLAITDSYFDSTHPTGTIYGSIDSTNYAVWVNGVQASLIGSGRWIANNVPINDGGTAVFQARAIPNDDNSGYGDGGNGDGSDSGGGDGGAGGGGGGSNPNSPNAIDSELELDKPPGWWLAAYDSDSGSFEKAMATSYTPDGGFYASHEEDATRSDTLQWKFGGNGSEVYIDSGSRLTNGVPESDSLFEVFSYWPEHLFTAFLYEDGELQTAWTDYAADPAVFAEHKDLKSSSMLIHNYYDFIGLYNRTWRRQNSSSTAQGRLHFFTGGKAIPGKWSTFWISFIAYLLPDNTEIDSSRIQAPFLGLVTLPNNKTLDVTPSVAGPKWYKFGLGEYQFFSRTKATTPRNLDRTTLGVGEEVDLYFYPSFPGNLTWTTTAGSVFPGTNYYTRLTAPSNAADATVTFTYGSMTGSTTFHVVEPTGVDHATITSTSTYGNNVPGAGMHVSVVIGPTNVSFYKVQMFEVGQPASNISGYFLNPQHTPLAHDDSTLANKWHGLNQDNSVGDGMDNCFYGTTSLLPSPWSPGSFTWHIPALWKVGNDGSTNSNLGWSDQVFTLGEDGTMTVAKFGHSVTRTIHNVITTR